MSMTVVSLNFDAFIVPQCLSALKFYFISLLNIIFYGKTRSKHLTVQENTYNPSSSDSRLHKLQSEDNNNLEDDPSIAHLVSSSDHDVYFSDNQLMDES